jgi:hypothetical protein
MNEQFYRPFSPKAIVRTNSRKTARKRFLPETAIIGGSLTGIYLLTGLVLRLCGVL